MNFDEFRRQMESYRKAVDDEAASLKDSYLALDRLHAVYRKFDLEERAMANKVLVEWALSEDENLRFDALALIDDLKIKDAKTALLQLASRLATSQTSSAPYELRKVKRIIADLDLV